MSEELTSKSRPRRAEQNRCPLSPSQERFRILDELDPDHAGGRVVPALRMRGSLNVRVLRLCLDEIIARHEVLRTTFDRIDGELCQIVRPRLELELPTEDLRKVPPKRREAELHKRLRLAAREPFDLVNGPLIRGRLLKLAAEDHVLLLATHHMVFDGLSKDVLYRELLPLYREFSGGGASGLPPLEWQYRDYARWQRERLFAGELTHELEYWAEGLGDGPPQLELPTDRPRTRSRKRRGDTVELMLSGSRLENLRALRAEENTSLTNLLVATFEVLLHRYTGQSDICLGMATGGRSSPELNSLVGVFINTVVLRTDLSGDPTFRAFLREFGEVTSGAYRHSEIPFEKVLDHIRAKQEVVPGTFPEVMCSVVDVSRVDLDIPQLEVERIDTPSQDPHFELTFYIYKHQHETRVNLVYDTALFDRSTIERMGKHYVTLLDEVAANPRARLSELPILGAGERKRVLLEWNETSTPYPRKKCVQRAFEEQVSHSPEAVAVEYEGRELSYSELNRRANRVAHHLIRHGVGTEVKVGVALERSLEMVVSILGVLKAGGSYVPLDPVYPQSRLAYMMQDTNAKVLLTQEHLVPNLPEHDGVVVRLDADWESIAAESGENPETRSSAEDLAYVMYTSGSTGRPKGSCIVHRSVVRLVKETNFIEVSPSDVFLQFAPISFDASTLELWAPLLNGAKLVVFPPRTPSLEELGRAIEHHGVTTLWLTGALFQQMVDSQPGSFRNVRQLLAGGDGLSVPHVRRVIEDLDGDRVLINGYGPTENTTFTCCHVMGPGSRFERSVPIGRPIANTRVYILDERMEPVPVGAPGELYAGGDGLAREYHNDPALTAEKLVPDPFGEDPGSRLYRTGDRARYLSDGAIEFLGRIDFQVKIRGFRIELGEIETALLRHEAIQEAVVICREDEPGNKYLAAYVVVEGEENEVSLRRGLREFLRGSLPLYMVPTAFVVLGSLPLNPNGKVDRRALPVPESQHIATREYVSPGTETEKTIATIWQEILGQDKVGLHDDFLDLGGHSLLATRILSRVSDSFELRLSVSRFFDRPTVAGLAELIDGTRWAAPGRDDRALAETGEREQGEV